MSTSLSDLAFLTRSPNRVAVLSTLADGPKTRAALVEETEPSRVTVGRILEDFRERAWVTQSEQTYDVTTRGRIIANELDCLQRRFDALERLDPVLEWFAVDRLDVPLASLADAEVTVPTPAEPNRHHRRIGTYGSRAERARMYGQAATAEAARIHADAVAERNQRLEIVFTPNVVEAANADPTLGDALQELAGTDGFVGIVEESLAVPFLAVFDERCFIGVARDSGSPVGVVESVHPDAVAWAERRLDELIAAADVDDVTFAG